MSDHPLFDATSTAVALEQVLRRKLYPLQVPEHIKNAMKDVLSYLESVSTSGQAQNLDLSPPLCNNNEPTLLLNVDLNRQTRLVKLYKFHQPNFILDYPETSSNNAIGYLFPMDLENWISPSRNFVYSLGPPKGSRTKYTKTGKDILIDLLVDNTCSERTPVPCRMTFSTCQGMKACPFVDMTSVCAPHTKASRQALSERFKAINDVLDSASPSKDLFLKTLTYYSAIKRQGCSSPLVEETRFTGQEKLREEERTQSRNDETRGHEVKQTCQGRLIMDYTSTGHQFIRCEHHNYRGNRDHFIDYNPGSGLLDIDYLEALFLDDQDLAKVYETTGLDEGIGPLAHCNVVRNFSSVKVNCSFNHRTEDGILVNPKMIHLNCDVKVKVYEPLDAYRAKCPWALVVCSGAHKHPIPTPSKTPPILQREICTILHSIESDIPDLTPRRFLRHPTLKAYLQHRLPDLQNAMLSDIHPSFANRDHLRWYIDSIKEKLYPRGTGWEGLLHLKSIESTENPYIRFIEEYPELGTTASDNDGTPLRIAICMLKENSFRLQKARYLQSDIGFKRVVGFKEFELGALESVSRTTLTYCRIYLNRETAEAHRLIFHKINDIVELDTGAKLKWRHIHSPTQNSDDCVGVLHFAGDQHGGQALGLGQYLCDVANSLPLKADLHEPEKNIQDLGPYDHLRRIFRLCVNHFRRNIQSCGVPGSVKKLMQSLMCQTHGSWNVTLRQIQDEGGKPAQDWLADKERAKFVFPAICWEKSCIPLHIWMVGDNTSNIIEQLHQDVNREGITCTLVGGAQKALHFDLLKLRTIQVYELTGVRPSYDKGTLSDSMIRSLKRQASARSKGLQREDELIESNNKRLQKALMAKNSAEEKYESYQKGNEGSASQIEQARLKMEKATDVYKKALKESISNLHSGSGKVGVLLPPSSFD